MSRVVGASPSPPLPQPQATCTHHTHRQTDRPLTPPLLTHTHLDCRIFRQIATFFEKVVFPCINWVCTRIGWFLSWLWDKFIKFVKFASELLWEITKFVLRRLFDAFGVLSLVLSCLAVWRLKTIYDCMFTLTFFHNEWKEMWAKREYSNVLFDGVVILESDKAGVSSLYVCLDEPVLYNEGYTQMTTESLVV